MSADERIVALRGQLEAAAARLATEESEKERLRGELARAQQKAQLAFDFRPPSGTAAPRPIQRKPPPPTPAESLPEKGLLLEHAGRRFLVVTTWEEARQATSDADRLKALLVIPSPEAPRR